MPTRQLWSSVVLAALAFARASHAQMSSSTPLQFNWYACPFQTAEDGAHDDVNATPAECADVAMPLCYPGVCTSTKTINVFVKRLLAVNPPPDKQPRAMWMVQGGPGFGSPSLEPGLLDAYEAFNGTLSVYTIDHRGTGRSSILNCTSNGDQPKGNLNQWQALAKCHRQLKALYGETSGPIGFSVTSAAMDIATVIQAPTLFNGTDVFVYGVSFGTYTVARVMHLQPSNVKGYVLDSIQSEEFGTTKAAPYYSNWDRDVGDAVDQYFAHCDKDAFCASKLGQPSSKQALVDVYAALDAKSSPCYDVLAATATAATPSEYVGSTLYTMLGDKSTWSLIAPFIFRLRRCSQDDVDMFGNVTAVPNAMMQTSMMSTSSLPLFVLPPNRGSAYLKDEGFSAILYNLIVFSELWEFPAPTLETMAAATTSALFGLKNTKRLPDAFHELCVYIQNNDPVCQGYPAYESGAGFIYPKDKYWNKTAAVPPGASVLLLSGLMDPATPAKYARDQFVNMKGLDKLLLQFPFGGHGTLSTTPLADQPNVDCANQIFYAYIQRRGKLQALDTTCVAKVQTLDFQKVLNSDRATAIFGTDGDVWGPNSPPLPPRPTTPRTELPSRSPKTVAPASSTPRAAAVVPLAVIVSFVVLYMVPEGL